MLTGFIEFQQSKANQGKPESTPGVAECGLILFGSQVNIQTEHEDDCRDGSPRAEQEHNDQTAESSCHREYPRDFESRSETGIGHPTFDSGDEIYHAIGGKEKHGYDWRNDVEVAE